MKAAYLVPAVGLAVSACSARYEVTRVTYPTDLSIARPGIVYALPKTQFVVDVPVTRKQQATGRYFGSSIWEDCVKQCIQNKAMTCQIGQETNETLYETSAPRVFTRAILDPEHVFRLNVDFGTFASFNHTFNLTDDGVLTSYSGDVSNPAVEVAGDALRALASVATATTRPSSDMEQCTVFQTSYGRYQAYQAARDALEAQADRVLYADDVQLTGPAIAELLAFHRTRLASLERSYSDVLSARRRVIVDESVVHMAAEIEPVAHSDFSGPVTWQPLNVLDLQGIETVAAHNHGPTTQTLVDEVQKKLALAVTVTADKHTTADCDPTDTASTATRDACMTDRSAAGLRYRVAVPASLKVSRDTTGNSPQLLGQTRTLVAQYGAVVALPAKVRGAKANANLELYASTGAARVVTVGATPQATTVVSDFTGTVVDAIEKREVQKAADEEAALNAEIDDLTRQRDLLQLRKEIDELTQELEE